MTAIAVSSFSLHRHLGPLQLETRDAEGVRQTKTIPMDARYTLEEFAREVQQRLGVASIELCQVQFADSTEARIARLKAALDDTNVTVLTVPIDVGDLSGTDPAYLREDLAEIERWLGIAHALGAKYARVNTGLPHVAGSANVESTLVDALLRLADVAAELGLRLLVENHGGASSDPEYLLALQAVVGRDKLGILLDLGNFEPINELSAARFLGAEVDEFAIDTEVVYKSIERLAPFADLVHAKAYDPRSDGSPLLDTERALDIVAASGYDGDITLEWEGSEGDPWERIAHLHTLVRSRFPA